MFELFESVFFFNNEQYDGCIGMFILYRYPQNKYWLHGLVKLFCIQKLHKQLHVPNVIVFDWINAEWYDLIPDLFILNDFIGEFPALDIF